MPLISTLGVYVSGVTQILFNEHNDYNSNENPTEEKELSHGNVVTSFTTIMDFLNKPLGAIVHKTIKLTVELVGNVFPLNIDISRKSDKSCKDMLPFSKQDTLILMDDNTSLKHVIDQNSSLERLKAFISPKSFQGVSLKEL